jgi:uncharacterized membrane protein
MREYIVTFAEWSASGIEAVGIAVIVFVMAWTLVLALVHILAGSDHGELYRDARRRLARGILLGLEFLVAADIIHTVAVDLTFESVGVLAIVVLIRTFLSFTLELESSGRWPWQKDHRPEHRHA